jgi:hypothetical protein
MGRTFPSAGVAIAAGAANSYLRYQGLADVTMVSYGMQECQVLRTRLTADRPDSMVGPSDSRGIVDAAQHESYAGTLR